MKLKIAAVVGREFCTVRVELMDRQGAIERLLKAVHSSGSLNLSNFGLE